MSTTSTVKREDIRFAIVAKNEINASITVEYWAEGYEFRQQYQIDLPINPLDHSIPTGQALTDLIMHFAPTDGLGTVIERFKQTPFVDFSHIDSLLQPSVMNPPRPTVEVPPETPAA